MALKGSLEDLGVVDLVQFVHQAHKTGALVLNGANEQARLFYRNGNLTDARMGEHVGLEVLVRTIDWATGEFEFLQGAESDSQTIDMDLHRAVMNAVKLRDERKAEEERKRLEAQNRTAKTAGNGNKPVDADLSSILTQLIATTDNFLHVSVLDAEGRVIGEAASPKATTKGLDELRACLQSLAKQYPRTDLRRLFIEDEAGTIVLVKVSEDRTILAVADRGAPLGAVAVGVGRFVSRLTKVT